MNNFIFENSTKVYFGKNALQNHLAEELKKYGETVLVGYGSGSIKKNGIYESLMKELEKAGKRVVEFKDIMPNPTYEKALEGARLVNENKVDLILAVGGGSVIDCCKAVSLISKYGENSWQDFWLNQGLIDFEPTHLGVILTLPASGSEVNGGAVITEEKTKIKMDRDYPELNPVFSIMDPTYMSSLPDRQLKAGGYDILSHIMETYFSKPDEDNLSDDISIALMKATVRSLRQINADRKDYNAASNLMWAGSLAENRLIKMGKEKDFMAHNIAHQVSAYTNVNHGNCLAIIQPVYYKKIYQAGLSKFKRFAIEVWQIDPRDKTDEQIAYKGIEALANFIDSLDLYKNLADLGVQNKEILKEIAKSTSISKGSYKILNEKEILEILEESY